MSTLSWNHCVLNISRAMASKLTSDAFVEVLRLDLDELTPVKEVDDVHPHTLTHLPWIYCSGCGAIHTSRSLSSQVSMWCSSMTVASQRRLVELDV